MNSNDLLKAVNVLNPRKIIPIHYTGWTHFKEKEQSLRNAIASNASIKGKTVFLKPGERTELF
jgi:L-ascorbate metabolism protein UlaG (beta-lactamase superfamily)